MAGAGAVKDTYSREDMFAMSQVWIKQDAIEHIPDDKLEDFFPKLDATSAAASEYASRLAQMAHDEGSHKKAHAWLKKSREAIAMHNLAFTYDAALGTTRSHKYALDWYIKAGLAASFYRAGLLLVNAFNLRKDAALGDPASVGFVQGLGMICVAAESGHPEANFVVGVEYVRGKPSVKEDITEKGMFYLNRASELGIVMADYELALAHTARAATISAEAIDLTQPGAAQKGFDRETRANECKKASFECVQRGAERGDPECQHLLAKALLRGHGCAKNQTMSLKWLIAAGDSGHKAAKYDSARMILRGIGSKTPNTLRARRILEELVEEKYVPAMCDLALLLSKSHGNMKADPARAEELTRAAADAEYIPAVAHMLLEKFVDEETDKDTNQRYLSILAAVTCDKKHSLRELAQATLVHLGKLDVCDSCHEYGPFEDGRELRTCKKCSQAHYCSRDCQVAAWPAHKKTCSADGEKATS